MAKFLPPRGVVWGALATVFVLGLGVVGAWRGLDATLMDTLFRARGARLAAPRIIVFLADDEMARRAGRLPLPRHFYGDAVTRLTRAGARTIALDIVFEAPSQPADDAALIAACAQSGRVVQAANFGVPPIVPATAPLAARFAVEDRRPTVEDRRPTVVNSAPLPIAPSMPALLASAPMLGHLRIAPDADGRFRRIPHLARQMGRTYPSLALAAAAHYAGGSASDIVASAGEIALSDGRGRVVRRIPLDASGQTLLNWNGPQSGAQRAFIVYPLGQLLDGGVPARQLHGCIALIGQARTGSYAPLATPFSQRDAALLPPVMLEANALDDILSERPLRAALPLWSAALSAIIGLSASALGAGALGARRGAVAGAFALLGTLVCLWLGAILLMRAGWYWPMATPLLSALAAGGAAMVWRAGHEAREAARVRELFGGYVGDEVLRQLKGGMPRLDGEEREVAVLFCDIKGFSGIAEELSDDPARLLALLNAHFAPLVAALKARDAYVDNYLGDMVIAVWGAPFSAGSLGLDTRNAVAAALDFQRIVAQANAQRAPGEPQIEVGIGLHCASAVVGNLGAAQKMHYTAIGDAVNIGARIESLTRSFDQPILVSEEITRALDTLPDAQKPDLSWRFIAQTSVKGRNAQVRVYAPVVGPQSRDEGDN